MDKEAKTFARVVLDAAHDRELSWNDKTTQYDKMLVECCDEAANKVEVSWMGRPVYYLLRYTWNDILDWAMAVAKDEPIP